MLFNYRTAHVGALALIGGLNTAEGQYMPVENLISSALSAASNLSDRVRNYDIHALENSAQNAFSNLSDMTVAGCNSITPYLPKVMLFGACGMGASFLVNVCLIEADRKQRAAEDAAAVKEADAKKKALEVFQKMLAIEERERKVFEQRAAEAEPEAKRKADAMIQANINNSALLQTPLTSKLAEGNNKRGEFEFIEVYHATTMVNGVQIMHTPNNKMRIEDNGAFGKAVYTSRNCDETIKCYYDRCQTHRYMYQGMHRACVLKLTLRVPKEKIYDLETQGIKTLKEYGDRIGSDFHSVEKLASNPFTCDISKAKNYSYIAMYGECLKYKDEREALNLAKRFPSTSINWGLINAENAHTDVHNGGIFEKVELGILDQENQNVWKGCPIPLYVEICNCYQQDSDDGIEKDHSSYQINVPKLYPYHQNANNESPQDVTKDTIETLSVSQIKKMFNLNLPENDTYEVCFFRIRELYNEPMGIDNRCGELLEFRKDGKLTRAPRYSWLNFGKKSSAK